MDALEGLYDHFGGRPEPCEQLRQRGFAKSATYPIIGKDVEVFTDPHSPSKRWGMEYAFLRVRGGVRRDNLAALVKVMPSRCGRLDFAFDFFEADWTVASLADALGRSQGTYVQGAEDGGDSWTVGKKGRRQVQVYDKGLELLGKSLPFARPDDYDPTRHRRIELRLWKPYAEPVWSAIRFHGGHDLAEAAQYVAWHVAERVPGLVLGECVEPEREHPPMPDVMQQVFHWARVASGIYCAVVDAGVDADSLLRMFEDRASRAARYRHAAIARELPSPDELVSSLVSMLGSRSGPGH